MRNLRFILIIVVSVVGLGGLALVLAARNPERRVARLLDAAQVLKRSGQLDKATACIEQAVELRPQDAGLKAKLGRSWAARGELAKAKPFFLQALALNADDVEARFDLFEVELAQGELALAKEQLATLEDKCKVLASEGWRDRLHAARASLLLRGGDRRAAARELEAALGVNPARDAELRVALAQVTADAGDAPKAEKLARDVWSVRRPAGLAAAATDDERLAEEAKFAPEPAVERAAGFLAQLLLRRGAPDEAAQIASEEWQRAPENAEIALVLAEAEVARRGYEAALAVAAKLEKANARVGAALVRGRVALAQGDRAKARSELQTAAALAPGAPVPALAAGECALQDDDKAEAARLALSIDPAKASLDDRVARARILSGAGKIDDARRELESVLDSAPGHAGAIDLLVRVELTSGRTAELTKRLEELDRRAPGNGFLDKAKSIVALWRHDPGQAAAIERDALQASRGEDGKAAELMTAALVLDGGVGAAVRELEKVASESKEDAVRQRARLQAADLYLTLGRADLALPVLERGLKEQPRSRDLRVATARAQMGAGRDKEAIATLGPLTDGEGDAEAFVVAAAAALRSKQPQAAVALAKRAVDDPTRGSEALAVLALAARDAGDPATARDAFAKLRAKRPSAALGYVGALALLVEDPAAAAKVLEQACKKTSAEAFGADLAIALDLAGRSPEALEAARTAAKSKGDTSAAYVLACVLARRGDPAGASDVLRSAGVAPEVTAAFRALPVEDLPAFEALLALRRHGLDREAAVQAEKLAARAPANLVVALHAARALAAAGKPVEAEHLLETAVHDAPLFSPARVELGYVRRLTRGLPGSIACYEEGLAAIPGDASLQLSLGITFSELGKKDEAEAAYRAVLAVDAKNQVARNNLAWLLLEKGTKPALDEGIALVRPDASVLPGSPLELDTLARLELARGDSKDALAHSRLAVERLPADATVRLGLAKALDATGETKGAANEYEIALLLSASFEGRDAAVARLTALRGAAPASRSRP